MLLSEPVRRVISDISLQFERLEAHNSILTAENEKLRSQLNFEVPGCLSQDGDVASRMQAYMKPCLSASSDSFPTGVVPQATMLDSYQSDSRPAPKPAPKVSTFQTLDSNSNEGGKPENRPSTPKPWQIDRAWTNSDNLGKAYNVIALPAKIEPGRPRRSLAASRLGYLRHEETSWDAGRLLNEFADLVVSRDARIKAALAVANNNFFKVFCIAVILANTLYVGFSADWETRNQYKRIVGQKRETSNYKIIDMIFAGWFFIELMIRCMGQRKKFFIGEDRHWNMFDAFLVLYAIVEVSAADLITPNLSFLRIFRVFRLVRVVRVVRTVKSLRNLRTMVFAVLNSFTSLLWAFTLIALINFIFGVIIQTGVAVYMERAEPGTEFETAQRLHTNFGTLYETMVTLFVSITGGNDWMMYASDLRLLHPKDLYFLIFIFYVAFCLIGMLNVVTGIFVDSAIYTRTEDEVVDSFKDDQRRTTEEVRRIFKDADKDGSGIITLEEFRRHLDDPWVKAYFSGLQMDPSDAYSLFTLMDTDGSNGVSIDEFVDGCMKMKGHAKCIDVLSLMYDSARFVEKFDKFAEDIVHQVVTVKAALKKKEKAQKLSNERLSSYVASADTEILECDCHSTSDRAEPISRDEGYSGHNSPGPALLRSTLNTPQ